MKRKKTALVLALLLVLLLAGGRLLYRQLAADAPASAADTPAPAPAAVETAPDFTVLDEAGGEVSLSDFFGEPIVVNIWASWCPPCRAELPAFDAVAAAYGEQVRFLMVDLTDGSRETVEIATAFRDGAGYAFPLYFDTAGSAVEAYQVTGIPVTLFIRADGSLLHRQVGSLDEASLDGYIRQLLADN